MCIEYTVLNTSRHAALWRDDLYPPVHPRKPRPWRDIAILASRRPRALPPPAAGRRLSSVRARRLRPTLACPTAHVRYSPGQIHNPIIIHR